MHVIKSERKNLQNWKKKELEKKEEVCKIAYVRQKIFVAWETERRNERWKRGRRKWENTEVPLLVPLLTKEVISDTRSKRERERVISEEKWEEWKEGDSKKESGRRERESDCEKKVRRVKRRRERKEGKWRGSPPPQGVHTCMGRRGKGARREREREFY